MWNWLCCPLGLSSVRGVWWYSSSGCSSGLPETHPGHFSSYFSEPLPCSRRRPGQRTGWQGKRPCIHRESTGPLAFHGSSVLPSAKLHMYSTPHARANFIGKDLPSLHYEDPALMTVPAFWIDAAPEIYQPASRWRHPLYVVH